jgi:hypothetical protein
MSSKKYSCDDELAVSSGQVNLSREFLTHTNMGGFEQVVSDRYWEIAEYIKQVQRYHPRVGLKQRLVNSICVERQKLVLSSTNADNRSVDSSIPM